MYFDAHTHLNDDALFSHRETICKECITHTIAGMIIVGVDSESNQRACMIASHAKEHTVTLKATVGLHPSLVSYKVITNENDIQTNIEALKRVLDKNVTHIVAIGECGIDAHYEGYDTHRSLQQALFRAQCLLARERGLPIVIHSRDQFNDTVHVLKEFPDLKVYFHCRSYTLDDLLNLEKTFPNLRIGFCGNITYPKAHDIRESANYLLTDPQAKANVLFETDAPYLSPQSKRGTQNTPLNVPLVYEFCAAEYGIALNTLSQTIQRSRYALFTSTLSL